MIVDLINYTRRVTIHPQDRTQLNNSAKNGGGITLMPGAGENDGWMVKYVVFHYPGGDASYTGNAQFYMRHNSSDQDLITPFNVSEVIHQDETTYVAVPTVYEMKNNRSVRLYADPDLSLLTEPLDLLIVATKIFLSVYVD